MKRVAILSLIALLAGCSANPRAEDAPVAEQNVDEEPSETSEEPAPEAEQPDDDGPSGLAATVDAEEAVRTPISTVVALTSCGKRTASPQPSWVTPTGEEVIVDGALEHYQVRNAMQEQFAGLCPCVVDRTDTLPGDVQLTAEFRVKPDGSVAEVAVLQSEHPDLAVCVQTEIATWEFPKSSGTTDTDATLKYAEILALGSLKPNVDAAVPSVVPGPPKIEGELSAEEVRRVFRTNRRDVFACVRIPEAATGGSEGQVTYRLKIDGEGKVEMAEVASTTLRNQPVEACIRDEFGGYEFPNPAGETAVIEYRLNFKTE